MLDLIADKLKESEEAKEGTDADESKWEKGALVIAHLLSIRPDSLISKESKQFI